MTRTFADTRRWASAGGQVFASAVARLLESPRPAGGADAGTTATALPGWTRAHLVAHVAANAEALSRLVHWAATGTPTPMYASPEQRATDIERGATRPLAELVSWSETAEGSLAEAMDALSEGQWQTEVVTAQGRRVPATELPWMRTREVWVHAVDLGADVTFEALPGDLLAALCDDVAGKRAESSAVAVVLEADSHRWELPGDGIPVRVTGTLPDVAAYLTGRPHGLSTVADGVPTLPRWL
jgi:uncharacterized protein (TIGR03083 family)